MQAWSGWSGTSAPAVKVAPTWDEWRACQRRIERPRESVSFSERELARLSFMRWLYQRGRLAPAWSDNVYERGDFPAFTGPPATKWTRRQSSRRGIAWRRFSECRAQCAHGQVGGAPCDLWQDA